MMFQGNCLLVTFKKKGKFHFINKCISTQHHECDLKETYYENIQVPALLLSSVAPMFSSSV